MSGAEQLTGRGLSFAGTPWTWAISLLAVAIAVAFALVAWRRSNFSSSVAGLELLRVMVIVVAVVLLNQPEWVEEYQPDSKPTIAVLWDQSPSMETKDVRTDGTTGPGNRTVTRAASIRDLVDPAIWEPLSEKLNVVIEPIGGVADAAGGPAAVDGSNTAKASPQVLTVSRTAESDDDSTAAGGTDLATPLMAVASNIEQLLGVVLISDGDWNRGPPPVEAASQLRMKGVPIFTIAAGSPTRLPDLRLTSLDVPTFATVGKPVRIPFSIDSSLARDITASVTLSTSDGETASRDVRIGAMSRTDDSIIWNPAETGDFTVSLDVPLQPGESIEENNSRSAPIAIREERLRVLVVETLPRWEYRYLRNALSRDPGVDVSCLLFHPGLDKVGGGSEDYVEAFPETIEALSEYDVVFLGDVGLDDGHLSQEQCKLLRGLVEHQASGLVFIPGWQGRQFSLLDTPLNDLYPVQLDATQPGGWGSRLPSRFELTESGRRSLLTKLADRQDENVQVWEDLPGFQWYAPVTRARAGAEVLAVHSDVSNQSGRLPLLVTRTFGAGKVLFMGTNGAWRWRKGVEDKYHYRFWGQVVRWMAYQRNMAKGETMRFYHTPDQPQLHQVVSLHAHVMDRGGEPIEQGNVFARIVAPSGESETVRLRPEGEQWGVFRGRYETTQPGRHDVTLVCKETSAQLSASFSVQGDLKERPGDPARPDVLDEIALVSQGESVRPEQLDRILERLAALQLPPPSIRRLQLWSHPFTAAAVVLLLAIFWVWRKAVGLI